MPNIPKKPVYEKPLSRDLFAFSAQGQVSPQGMCTAGPTPYYTCNVGTSFVGACSPGSTPDTSACATGALHNYPSCNAGSSASTTCISEAHQNF